MAFESPDTFARRLKQEIESWRPYAEALRMEDRQIFRQMMNDVATSYSEAVDRAERGYDTEAVLMSVLLVQQKAISWLSTTLKKVEESLADRH